MYLPNRRNTKAPCAAAYDARNAQADKDRVSEIAVASLMQLPEYQAAQTVLWYLDCRSELRTRHALPAALASGKRVIVPYCTVDDPGRTSSACGGWRAWMSWSSASGRFWSRRASGGASRARRSQPEEIDLVVVPGVGFSREGGRMGNGQGYYDRLLERVRPDCPLVGLCYECQLFDDLIVDPHDVFMDKVVTERAVYEGRGRQLGG